ncbi:phospholipase D-like domain-containing protein [Flavihumibacter profundi]|uniref:phospholipase D-like domain-containing protein n=1 Tax=Flavihumibacter profundi TaxID=2716883 RepID=UPI001CC43337|nr:phospholipase D-like domain-containing protein [Flavihumibacter profundi]MBZ5859206.1 phospholipase D-like domain-containing protein [Flavihumibacter profundi]
MSLNFPREGYTTHNQVKLIRGGKDYFDCLVELLRKASHSIHMQMYIFDDDETGRSVLVELLAAAKRGVTVFLLLDGYASQNFSRRKIEEIRASGIHFRWFEPFLRSRYYYFGRRLHHKIVVADGIESLVGGINIGNRYNDLHGRQAWLDWAVFTRGEAAGKLYYVCQVIWNKSGWGKKKWQRVFLVPQPANVKEECLVRVRREDWVRRKSEISASYLLMLKKAEKEVVIMSSYFLPGRQIRKNLDAAAKRGVSISVITAGKSDISMAKHAERYLYRWMLDRNIKIYEYQKNILHGKISCADGILTTVGSYNVNFLSAYASIELNLDILDAGFGKSVHQQLLGVMEQDSLPITDMEWQQHYNFLERFWQKTCYDTIRLMFYLFTFYFRQHK